VAILLNCIVCGRDNKGKNGDYKGNGIGNVDQINNNCDREKVFKPNVK